MSHMTRIQGEIKSLAGLETACHILGLTFHRGATKARYYDGTGIKTFNCDHVIEVPGYADQISVTKKSTGYVL